MNLFQAANTNRNFFWDRKGKIKIKIEPQLLLSVSRFIAYMQFTVDRLYSKDHRPIPTPRGNNL